MFLRDICINYIPGNLSKGKLAKAIKHKYSVIVKSSDSLTKREDKFYSNVVPLLHFADYFSHQFMTNGF